MTSLHVWVLACHVTNSLFNRKISNVSLLFSFQMMSSRSLPMSTLSPWQSLLTVWPGGVIRIWSLAVQQIM